MKKNAMSYWVWIMVSTSPLFAGDEKGGGHAVVCYGEQNSLQSVSLLDFHEAKIFMKSFKLDMGIGETEYDRVRFVLDRLSKLDSARAEKYRKLLDRFEDQKDFLEGYDLPLTNDHNYIPVAPCVVKQFALQRDKTMPDETVFLIQKELWNKMTDVSHRAGLVLHEIVYRFARTLGHKSSRPSRYFTALISSSHVATLSQAEYEQRVKEAGLEEEGTAKPPFWSANPVTLPGAKENQLYNASVAAFAVHPGGKPLQFQKVGGPSWLSVASNGVVSGTPTSNHIGQNIFVLRATAGSLSADVQVHIEVQHVNPLPLWIQDPIILGDAYENRPWQFLLKPYVTDGDIAFGAGGLPRWMRLDPVTGTLSGTPTKTDLGTYTVELIAASKSGQTAKVTGQGKVLHTIKPPHWISNLINLPNVHVYQLYSTDITQFVFSMGDTLTFSKISGPAWVMVRETGKIVGTPQHPDVGMNDISVKVCNQNGECSVTTLRISVIGINHPPYWFANPINISVQVETAMVVPLASYATDVDGDVLVFKIVDGKSGPSLSTNGVLLWIPTSEDIGVHKLIVSVTDGKSVTQAQLNISVEKEVVPLKVSAFRFK